MSGINNLPPHRTNKKNVATGSDGSFLDISTRCDSSSSTIRHILGIDLGTTSVKVCLMEERHRSVSDLHFKDTLAGVPSDGGSLGNQQDPGKIYHALHSCLARIPRERLRRVVRIAIAGQMHGVMFWKSGHGWFRQMNNAHDHFEVGGRGDVSSLYTWQDARCGVSNFMSSLPQPQSHLRLATGYGCVTIFWLRRHRPDFLTQFDTSGTLMDFVVAMITNNQGKAFTSIHNAASWGYFDTVSKQWNLDILERHDFPVDILPRVVDPGVDVGSLSETWFDVPKGTPVSVALGDLQCSVRSTYDDPSKDCVLNISTSAQMAFVMPKGFAPSRVPGSPNNHLECAKRKCDDGSDSVVELLPYLDGRHLSVAASLTGGNCLAAFVKMIQMWVVDLGLSIPQSKIWEKIMANGLESVDSSSHDQEEVGEEDALLMEIIPRLYGERHNPQARASASSICPGNLSLGKVMHSLCKGIVNNLASMMTPEMIHEAGMKRIVGSGACLSRNQVLKSQVQEIYKLPVVFAAQASACIGACHAVLDATSAATEGVSKTETMTTSTSMGAKNH